MIKMVSNHAVVWCMDRQFIFEFHLIHEPPMYYAIALARS